MKHFTKKIVLLFLAITLMCCSKKEDKKIMPSEQLKEFKISQLQTSVPEKGYSEITILSGNGEYQVSQTEDSKKVAQVELKDKKIAITGQKSGKTIATITDVKSKNSIEIKIEVTPPPMVLKDFSIEKNEISLKENQTEKIKILSGNGNYKPDFDAHLVEVSINGEEILVKGLKQGNTSVKITDTQKNQTLEIKVTISLDLKDFKLEKQAMEITHNASETLKIISGNGDYTIDGGAKVIEARLSDDKKSVVVKAIEAGSTKLTITDTKSKTSQQVKVVVVLKHQEQIPTYDLTHKSAKKFIDLTKETIKKYDETKAALEKLPMLGDTNKGQTKAWDFGRDLAEKSKKSFASYTEKTELQSLQNAYENIYLYGYAYATVEFMARRCEVLKKLFPSEKSIEQLLKDFDGKYTSQEGGDFFTGLNRDYVQKYNEMLNKINQFNRSK